MESNPIEIRGLRKNYGEKRVLDGVDLVVGKGQILGYVGPNGAGKSTTVKILTGLLDGFTGEVRVAGFDPRVDAVEVKRRIGYVPENAVLYESLTIAEFLLFVGRLHNLDDASIQRRADEFLAVFDLAGRLHSRITTLSKGMRQKVLLTAAVLHDPEVLLVDEPLSGLDVNAMILIKEFLRGFADRGRAVFYCSHVMEVVERVCDRIAILHQGKIAAIGTFTELQTRMPGGSLERIFAELTSDGSSDGGAKRLLDALS